jgi:DNA-binding NarL/FixJ family response regulator
MAAKKYSIVLADDHPFILFALRQLILAEPEFEIVGEASTGLRALSLIRGARPDVAIVDVAMPEMNGVVLARKLKEELPQTKVIMLTAYEDEAHLKQTLAAGVAAYVAKRAAAESLIPALRAALVGGTFVDPLLMKLLNGTSRRAGEAVELTDREREVLRLTALGHSTKEIAGAMVIGGKTVDTYRSRACDKLGLKSRVEIVRFAIGEGWLS